MTRHALPLIVAFFLAFPAFAQPCTAIDGDTLRCGDERVRLRGIYAPERSEPGGEAARQRLAAAIAGGELVLDRRGRDRYRRTLAHAYVDGRRIVQADISPRGGRGR